ncbi:hypothetical protein FB379_11741 [Aeribacillus composti]|nr:hypothetical protein FB379_11741 [Aeribacillus composti]
MAQIEEFVHVERISMLMEMILSRENLLAALKRVEQNKGSHGVDGMSVKDLRRHLYENWDSIRQSLREGTYKCFLQEKNTECCSISLSKF